MGGPTELSPIVFDITYAVPLQRQLWRSAAVHCAVPVACAAVVLLFWQ